MTTPVGAALLGAAGDDLHTCVHCGFCLPVCPTYLVLGDENDSPRGRLVLMRAAANDEIPIDGSFGTHIDRCLGCRACETVCPAGVEYGHLLEKARGDIASGHGAATRIALDAITTGRAARAVYAAGRAVRAIRPLSAIALRMPGSVGRLAGLLDASRPTQPAWHSAGSVAARTDHTPDESAEWSSSYALLEGCVMSGLFAHVHDSTRRVLAAAGSSESVVEGQTCCGALHAHAGFLEHARDLARRNIEAFEAAPEAWVVTDSAGCGAALRDYPEWLADDPGWRSRAANMAARVRDVSEALADVAERLPPMRLEGLVVYDAPCHLLHAQGVRSAPLAALERIEGLEVRLLPSSDTCCGGAGLYNLQEPALAARVIDPKLEEIHSVGCDWVATGNPGCIMFIGSKLREQGRSIPVLHPVELLDLALSGR